MRKELIHVKEAVFILIFLAEIHFLSNNTIIVMEEEKKLLDSDSPVFAVYYPSDIAKSPRELFPTVKEAAKFLTSPEAKSNGARFRRFGTPKEAAEFFAAGDCVSPSRGPAAVATGSTPNEPVVPYSSVSGVQCNTFKRAVEKGDIDTVRQLVDENPRYLINTGADQPTILAAGFRFNALYLAAKAGQTEIVKFILDKIHDVSFLVNCYGTTEEDARFRMTNIIDSYLNTPDKGANETPLQIAVKFGHLEAAKLLMRESMVDVDKKNKEGKTAREIVCARYSGKDKESICQSIRLLFGSYVALYRTEDNWQTPKIIVTQKTPATEIELKQSSPGSLFRYSLAASAGPFLTKEKAEDFLKKWSHQTKASKIALEDADKGYERIGRELCGKNIPWQESWIFLHENPVLNFRNDDDLRILEAYLRNVRMGKPGEERKSSLDEGVRRKLCFDDDDGESDDDDDFEDFKDASDLMLPPPESLEDSLYGLAGQFANLQLNSPKRDESVEDLQPSGSFDDDDVDDYITPPSSPVPFYVLGEPSKIDNDLYLGLLSQLPEEKLEEYPSIKLFMDKISRQGLTSRAQWPPLNSPRLKRSRAVRN